MKDLILAKSETLLELIWETDTNFKEILKRAASLKTARDNLFEYFYNLDRAYFNLYSKKPIRNLHKIERNNAKECLRIFKNIIRTENEYLSGYSSLDTLWQLANNKIDPSKIKEGFLIEILFLLKGINGKAFSHLEEADYLDKESKREKALARSKKLDKYSSILNTYMSRYVSGLDKSVVAKREELKEHIINYFNASKEDWDNYKWQLDHIISDIEPLMVLIKLEDDEIAGLNSAKEHNIPFQITPYYLSLFNKEGRSEADRVLRSLVIPSVNYCESVVQNKNEKSDLDFMDEKSTSPIDCITRRYPQIVILKPFDSCPQICVYCQRNWEIKSIDSNTKSKEKVAEALKWIKNNKNITEVLVTGGDPLTLDNDYINWILSELNKMQHVERIRIGTRILVTMPQRINEGLLEILNKFHKLGKQEICIMTHFEHSTELTPDSLKAIEKIKKLGINIYNQQVFTFYNSRKFESCALRKILKLSGVEPYYSFNTKGKKETLDFRVPIARIEQERKEEARLLPGLVRTDEPVFNVPRLGKSQLVSWQDHEIIMIMPDGSRMYRFYPWESRHFLADTYEYKDVPIYDYLKKLNEIGEDLNEYISIWYYF